MSRKNRARRGVVLLITLSLLILFLLIGITYVLTGGQFKRSANIANTVGQFNDPPSVALRQALYELLRGSQSTQSPIGSHSILENEYGDLYAYGAIGASLSDVAGTGGQFKTMVLNLDTTSATPKTKVPAASLATPGYFNGCVATFVDGPCAGGSTRIVGYLGDSRTFWVLPLDLDVVAAPGQNNHVLINGRQFSGTGPAGTAVGLQPNCANNTALQASPFPSGMNPDYTAPDLNTMFLAWRPGGPDNGSHIIPSFYRPALLNYLKATGGSTDDKNALLRPTKAANPIWYATVNPNFDPINGPWDVNNTGDGVPDSIWVDPAFPTSTHKDGRVYKTLVAYHVLDMDGKMNLNAHGGAAQTAGTGLGVGSGEINLMTAVPEAGAVMGARGTPTVSATAAPYLYKFFEYPAAYRSFPPDLNGTGTVTVNSRGLPVFTGQSANVAAGSNPYLTNLSPTVGRPNHGSTLFTAAEFEAVLRMYDIDAQTLPPRLSSLINSASERFLVGIDSNDIPGFSPLPTADLRASGGGNRWACHIVDLMRQKLANNGITGAAANTQLQILLPPELAAGLKMNLNRSDTAVSLNDDLMIKNAKFYRQIEARHLFALMMLLTDTGFLMPTAVEAPSQELTAQRLAQWAINVIDFKDPDSIMSPFEYVLNPFTGWNVNGDPATNEATSGANANRRLVWGCEYPDLLLMEAIATHDRRVQDTDNDDGKLDAKNPTTGHKRDDPKFPDQTLDQVRIPQGSLFIKLYCTGSLSGQAGGQMPQELYNANNKLDLEKVSPAAGDGISYPVWRLAISTSTKKDVSSDVRTRMGGTGKPDSTSLQPQRMSLTDTSAAPTDVVNIERIVWFTTQPAGALSADPPNTAPVSYFYNRSGAGSAALSPGQYALVGPRDRTWFGSKNDGTASTQSVDLTAATASTAPYSIVKGGANSTPGNTQAPLSIICAADKPTTWSGTGGAPNIGLNVSEPLPSAANYYKQPTAKWPTAPAAITYNDAYGVAGDNTQLFPDLPFDSQPGMPLKSDNALQTGTYINYRTVFLQRLADPTAAFNKDTNPYLTVDWMPVDLTVFNGENQNPTTASTASPFDPDDQNPGKAIPVKFATRLRGLKAPPATAAKPDYFWKASWNDDPATTANDGSTNNFPYKLTHSFAYLNSTFGAPTGPNPGDPATPFPWLTWNNRPFVSPHELMMVPSSTPGRLTTEFSLPTMTGPIDVYNAATTSAHYPFYHLLNFFQTNSAVNTSVGNFYRIFDYVGVPSPFVGTEIWFNPNTVNVAANAGWPYLSGNFRAPFNYVSNYRDPGKINLNTINSPAAWNALLNGNPGPTWDQFVRSRAGYNTNTAGGAVTTLADTNPAFPTTCAGAFRSSNCADQVPVASLKREGVDATLLRRSPDKDPTTGLQLPLFAPGSNQDATNTNRNPYFTYQGIDRLSNLTTTRSNVFAVWITIGYFEVLPSGALGAEIGSDTGDVKRHRAFYIIDRSIPVGFERGQDYNVQKAIVLQRYIE